MEIAILDQTNARVIIGHVPSYLSETDAPDDDIAAAVLIALGLPVGTEYMLGHFQTVLADHNADSSRTARGIELLAQDFQADALEALADLTA